MHVVVKEVVMHLTFDDMKVMAYTLTRSFPDEGLIQIVKRLRQLVVGAVWADTPGSQFIALGGTELLCEPDSLHTCKAAVEVWFAKPAVIDAAPDDEWKPDTNSRGADKTR